MSNALTQGLKDLTDAELQARFDADTDATREAVLSECKRRDTLAAAHAAGKAWWDEVREAWELAFHAQWTQAEAYTVGHMVNEKGEAKGLTDRDLWTKPEDYARRYATQELVTFWDYVTPRVPTVGVFAAQVARHAKDEREAYATAA